jgi:adenylate kinase family enzyme
MNTARVLCHIAGPSGAGKSTLLERIATLFPGIVTKDLDDFDDEGSKMLGLDAVKKKDWQDENFGKLAKIKQELLDEFLTLNVGKHIVLAGFHTEDEFSLTIPTKNKFLLNVDAETCARRALERGCLKGTEHMKYVQDLPQRIKEAQEEIKARLNDCYVMKSDEEIIDWLKKQIIDK